MLILPIYINMLILPIFYCLHCNYFCKRLRRKIKMNFNGCNIMLRAAVYTSCAYRHANQLGSVWWLLMIRLWFEMADTWLPVLILNLLYKSRKPRSYWASYEKKIVIIIVCFQVQSAVCRGSAVLESVITVNLVRSYNTRFTADCIN